MKRRKACGEDLLCDLWALGQKEIHGGVGRKQFGEKRLDLEGKEVANCVKPVLENTC